MASVLKRMPDAYSIKNQPIPDIRDHLEQRSNPKDGIEAALFVARQKSWGNVVGLAGVVVEDDPELGKTAIVTEFAVAERASRQGLGDILVREFVKWAEEQSADHVLIDVPPEPGSTAEELLIEKNFEPSSYGKPLLNLQDES